MIGPQKWAVNCICDPVTGKPDYVLVSCLGDKKDATKCSSIANVDTTVCDNYCRCKKEP